jgi:hypothetical protein
MEFRADASPPGLYATKAYEVGDVIIDEAPLFLFRPLSPEDDKAVSSQFKNVTSDPEAATKKAASASYGGSGKKKGGKKKKKSTSVKFVASIDDVQCPSHVDSAYAGKFRAMVTGAAMYAHGRKTGAITDDIRRRILSLYAPNIESPGDDERVIVSTACAALKYCRDSADDESNLSKLVKGDNEAQRECLQIMLIWSCNSFEGGMLYEQTSRINHSCDANAIVRESPKTSPSASAKAAEATTKDDDEDDMQHQEPVQQQVVATSAIEAGDEITISYLGIFGYAGGAARLDQLRKTKHFTCRCSRCSSIDIASAVPCLSCHPRINSRYLDEEVQYDDDKAVKYSHPKNAACVAQSMQCQHCGEMTNAASLMTMVNKVCDKVTARLERSSSTTAASRSDDDDNDPTDTEQEMDEQLFHLSSSVLGAQHWTTNLMALSMLNRQLSAIHAATLMGGSPPDLTELAECIDTLQRLWDYVDGLNLKADPAHLLCGPTIGIARALVSLGDVKSRKFAAEWIEKVEEYVRKFEMEGMVKVVEALKEAWKRDDFEAVTNEDMDEVEEGDMGSNKRARVC